MTRTFTTNATTQAERQMGSEPIVLVKVEWGGDVGTRYYAGTEKTIGTIVTRPQLLEIAGLTWQLKQFQAGTVASVAVKLDDSEGDLNTIVDSMSVQDRTATILLHFEGNGEADLVTMVKGKLVSPLEWFEGDRVLSFVIESFVTESEVGFAPREEEYSTLPHESDGKAWPICFGSPLLVPAVRVQKRAQSVLTQPFKAKWHVDEDGNLTLAGDTSIVVEDGSDFPVGNCAINVGGIVIRGVFAGNSFVINSFDEGINLPKFPVVNFDVRVVDDVDFNEPAVAWLASFAPIIGHFMQLRPSSLALGATSPRTYKIVKQEGKKVWFDEGLTDDSGNPVILGVDAFPGEVAWVPRYLWSNPSTDELPSGFTWIIESTRGYVGIEWGLSAGTKVIVWEDYESLFTQTYGDIWVCNLIPSTGIHAVYAEKDGVLTPIPKDFYQKWTSVTLPTFGKTVSAIYIPFTLSELPEQGWGDQVYVVLTSTEGPNVANVIKYLLDTYSEFDTDASSFTDVAAAVANYPVNFALLEKKSTLQVCEDIAWQARCALVYSGTSVKIKYLSVEPASDASIAEANILQDSVKLSFTPAEDVVTRFVAEWRQNYFAKEPFTVTFENNIAAFGLNEEQFQFYIYNERSLVYKSARFWSTRLGHSWQLASLTTFMEMAKLEVHDCLTLALDDETIFNVADVKSIVHGQKYDLKAGIIEKEIWLPRVAGSSSVHADAWLSDDGDVLPAAPYLVWSESDPVMSVKPAPKRPKLAKIVRKKDVSDIGVTWDYLINEYENGYDQPPTKEGIGAKLMDEELELAEDQPITTVPTNTLPYIQTQSGGIILATIGSRVSGSLYNWTKFAGSGTSSGQATEMNGSTAVAAGMKVVLHQADGSFYFFFPIASC